MQALINRQEYLTADEEFELGRRWRDQGDEKAIERLVLAYWRMANRRAQLFVSYGIPLHDLAQEAAIGLIVAARRFDPEKGVRFGTYARWWVMEQLRSYVLRNWSIIQRPNTTKQKKLFYSLRRVQEDSAKAHSHPELQRERTAKALGVELSEVEEAEVRIAGKEFSLDMPINEDSTLAEIIPSDLPNPEEILDDQITSERRREVISKAMERLSEREREIVSARYLDDDRSTLTVLSEKYGLTRERIRQIEVAACRKMKKALGKTAIELV